MARRRSRLFLTVGAAVVLIAILTWAFLPRPLRVDIGEVTRGAMRVTIDEEGRTRVHDRYVVSTPFAGRLLRVAVEPGDVVVRGESVVAHMRPAAPAVLDVRARAQARAELAAAEAGLRAARAERLRALAARQYSDRESSRVQELRRNDTVPEAELDRVRREASAAAAALDSAEATIALREAELTRARATLARSGDPDDDGSSEDVPVRAPASGTVLEVMQSSEATVPAGTPVLEIGDIDNDLEVLVELLSSDALQVSPGMGVQIETRESGEPLAGIVRRVEPRGFTKVSALGVEEQRVNTIVGFEGSSTHRARLGDGFRVEVRIVIWEDSDALIVPSSALFRDGAEWSLFVVADGVAERRVVDIGRNNGLQAQINAGVRAGERVVLFPSSALEGGQSVAERSVR